MSIPVNSGNCVQQRSPPPFTSNICIELELYSCKQIMGAYDGVSLLLDLDRL